MLREWAITAPAHGGYDKVAIKVTWSNEMVFHYRLDLKHPDCGETLSVEDDTRHEVDFALGRKKHHQWTDEQYRRVLERFAQQGVVDLARQIDETCMIGDY